MDAQRGFPEGAPAGKALRGFQIIFRAPVAIL